MPKLNRSTFAPRSPAPLAFAVLLAISAVIYPQAPLFAQSENSPPDWQQAAGGKLEFDVASVRQNKSDGPSYSNFSLDNGNAYFVVGKDDAMTPRGSLFSARNQTLLRYIVFAYKLSATQELALRFDYYKGLELHVPAWVRQNRFDIEARGPGNANKDQMRLMMQSLLAERFKLAAHWETRDVPVFALALDNPGRLGPQLRPHPANDDCTSTAFPEDPGGGKPAPHSQPAIPIPCGEIAHLPASDADQRRFGGRNVNLPMLAQSLPAQTGLATLPRPVIDATGLTGGFDFSIQWTPEDTSPIDNHETGGSFRDALKHQLGLKLEPRKAPVEVLVIDRAEPPSPN